MGATIADNSDGSEDNNDNEEETDEESAEESDTNSASLDAAEPASEESDSELDASEPDQPQQGSTVVTPSTSDESSQIDQNVRTVTENAAEASGGMYGHAAAIVVGGTCGDGQRSVTEACDDGNKHNGTWPSVHAWTVLICVNVGDGCNSDCSVEDGFTCWSGHQQSSCWMKKQFEAQLMAVTVRGYHRCMQQRMPGFLLHDPTTGAGRCSAMGPQHLPKGFSSAQYQQGGGLAMLDTITSRVTVAVTRPQHMSLHASPAGVASGEPYAVCRSTRVSACGTTDNANATHCAWAGR